MRDWKGFVEERLALTGLRESRRSSIVEEVASQLEDLYSEARSRGLTEPEAEETILRHIPDWGELDQAILDYARQFVAEDPKAQLATITAEVFPETI